VLTLGTSRHCRYDCGKQNKKVKKQNFLPLQKLKSNKKTDNKEKQSGEGE
jgi:hypothetical protein